MAAPVAAVTRPYASTVSDEMVFAAARPPVKVKLELANEVSPVAPATSNSPVVYDVEPVPHLA